MAARSHRPYIHQKPGGSCCLFVPCAAAAISGRREASWSIETPGPTDDRRAPQEGQWPAPYLGSQAEDGPAGIRDRQAQVEDAYCQTVSPQGDGHGRRRSLSGQRAQTFPDTVRGQKNQRREDQPDQDHPGGPGRVGPRVSGRGLLRDSPGIANSSRRGQSRGRGGQIPSISRREGAGGDGRPVWDETGQTRRRMTMAVVPQADMARKIAR